MIDKLPSIPLGWKLVAVAVLVALAAATTFHFTSLHYAEKIGELGNSLRNKDAAIGVATKSIDTLVKSIDSQNEEFEKFAEARRVERREALSLVNKLEAEGKGLRKEIDGLRIKVPRPAVDPKSLTAAQIAEEIGECRRAVEINNTAVTGELL